MNHSLQVQSGPRRLLTTVQALLLLALLALLAAPPAQAITTSTTYTLPAALTSSPFNCTMATATIYDCSSVSLDKDALLVLTSDVTIRLSGSFSSAKNLATSNQNHALQLTTGGNVSMQKDTDIDMSITAGGNISFAKNARVDGNLTAGGSLILAKDSTINGNVTVGGNLTGAKNDVINGICTVSGTSNIRCNSAAALHHVRATFTGSTTTCGNTAVTITACASADSNGTCTAYTGGISGTLTADATDDSTLASVSFSIGSGSSSTTVSLPAISAEQTAEMSFDYVSKTTTTQGTCWNGSANDCTLAVNACGADHVRLSHAGNGVTCVPSTVTVYACSDADVGGSCTANTTGIAGTVVATGSNGSQVASTAFSIPAGSSSASVSIPVTTAQTVTFSTSGLTPAPSGNPQTTCWNGGSTSCSYTYADSGFIFDVADHQAGNVQSVTMQAVKKADNSTACTPTLGSGNYPVSFSCNYTDPTTGSQNVTVANSSGTQVALACNASGSPLSLSFNASQAAISVSYPDSGKVTLSASYTNNGVTISGNDTFVAAPTKFVIGTTTSPLQADVAFNATVTAVNSSGATMPNFGKESGAYRAQLTFSKCGGANTGTFGGSLSSTGVVNMPAFSSGVSTATGLKYSEVGTLDGTATMTDSGYTAATAYLTYATVPTGKTNTASSGCSGSFGAFQPAYFTTAYTNTSASGATNFAYSGVPFKITVTPKNGSGSKVKNYIGSYAKGVTLSAVNGGGSTIASTVGAISTNTIAATDFATDSNGYNYAYGNPTFTFPAVTGGVNGTKLKPQKIYVRATDANSPPVTSGSIAIAPTQYEALVEVRYGRLRLFNAYGASLSSVKMPLQAEYWTGSTWVVNGDDSTTSIPAAAFGFASTNTVSVSGQSTAVSLAAGKGTFTVTQNRSGGSKGYADIAVNLGITDGPTASCLGTNPTGTTAPSSPALTGLRSYFGCGTGAYTYDPSARAYFGVQSQETKGVVHVREVFN